jgi:hypothetical protein
MFSKRKWPDPATALLFLALSYSASAQAPAGVPPSGSQAPPYAGGGGNAVVAEVSFKGNTKFSDATLLKAVNLHPGEAMSPALIKDAVSRLVAYYRSHGANLSAWPNIDPDGGHAVVQFVIDEHGTKGDAGAYPPAGGR